MAVLLSNAVAGGIRLVAVGGMAPEEFASRVKTDCERIKWMAQNAVRTRPQK
jgi:hypothetical protein